MHILLNGERRNLPGPRTVRELLADLGIVARAADGKSAENIKLPGISLP